MQIGIISNFNGIGLQRDAELLRDHLTELGHSVVSIQYDQPFEYDGPTFHLCIFLEVIPRHLVNLAPVRWAFLNPEFCNPEVVKMVHRHIDKVFAKTHEAKRIFDEAFPGKTFYTGFLARDQFGPTIKREAKFLHIGGNSSVRGTQELYDAWKWSKHGRRIESHLYIVSRSLQERPGPDLPNVHVMTEVDEASLKNMQNESIFHVYPSGTEGYGHAMRESLSVGACLIVTDGPPMNEIEYSIRIPTEGKRKFNLADVYEVSALDIHNAVREVLDDSSWFPRYSLTVRRKFLDDNEAFKSAFSGQLATLEHAQSLSKNVQVRSEKPSIAFIGNFEAEHSTENQIKWALEQGLGYEVETLQENKTDAAAIRYACEYSNILIWVRTPGWLRVPDAEMFELLADLKRKGVKTLSVHLDKFFGIPEREALIGKIPFWRTEFCFTADGSRQEDFKARGVNHFWMRPAVSEVFCHPGTPRDEYRCDVGFVGAKEYHSEYPFRRQMVDYLEEAYGERFKHVQGVRGHLLNDVYASMKVVVGDCIFAGTPNYWSDRVPETVGRFGNLLHPKVIGLDITSWVYEPQDLDSLKKKIEMCLNMEPRHRNTSIQTGAEQVRKRHTWTARIGEILETIR